MTVEVCAGYRLATIPAFRFVVGLVGEERFGPDPPSSTPELDDDTIVDPIGDPQPGDGLAIVAEYHGWRHSLPLEERGTEILPFVMEDPQPMISLFIPIRILDVANSTVVVSETSEDSLKLQNILAKLNGYVDKERHLDQTHLTFMSLPLKELKTRPFTTDVPCKLWDMY